VFNSDDYVKPPPANFRVFPEHIPAERVAQAFQPAFPDCVSRLRFWLVFMAFRPLSSLHFQPPFPACFHGLSPAFQPAFPACVSSLPFQPAFPACFHGLSPAFQPAFPACVSGLFSWPFAGWKATAV